MSAARRGDFTLAAVVLMTILCGCDRGISFDLEFEEGEARVLAGRCWHRTIGRTVSQDARLHSKGTIL